MNSSRFFSALIVAALTFGISGGAADAVAGKIGTFSQSGLRACVDPVTHAWGYCPDQPHIAGWGQNDYDTLMNASSSSGVATCDFANNTCSVNGVAGSLGTRWESAGAKSDLTAFDDTSEAEDSDWADSEYEEVDSEYEEDDSDCEWDEEDTESESWSDAEEEAEADLEGAQCHSNADCGTLAICIDGYCAYLD